MRRRLAVVRSQQYTRGRMSRGAAVGPQAGETGCEELQLSLQAVLRRGTRVGRALRRWGRRRRCRWGRLRRLDCCDGGDGDGQ